MVLAIGDAKKVVLKHHSPKTFLGQEADRSISTIQPFPESLATLLLDHSHARRLFTLLAMD
jgi:hypothetical protein